MSHNQHKDHSRIFPATLLSQQQVWSGETRRWPAGVHLLLLTTVLVTLSLSLACNLADTPVPSPDTVVPPTTMPSSMIRQWAIDAVASSQYSDPDWSALQAVGPPDTPSCGDIVTAWASAGSNTIAWLNLYYDTPVHIREINIVQTYQPDQVVRVDLIDLSGEIVPLYSQEPYVARPCPYTLSIKIPQTDRVVQGIRITVDQSMLGLGWNEIDAVELVGLPGRGVAVRPAPEASPSLPSFSPTSVPIVTSPLIVEGSELTLEKYTDRTSFEARLNGRFNVVDFDDVDTSGDEPVSIEPDRYQATAGIIISGEQGQYVDDTFGFPNEFRAVSSPNMYAPGPPATGNTPPPRGGHHTDITFSVDGQRAAVAGFGVVFIDADFPGIGPSGIAIFDHNERQIGSESEFKGTNGSQLFQGLVVVDDQGDPTPVIFGVHLVNGNEWPAVDVGVIRIFCPERQSKREFTEENHRNYRV